MPPPSLSPRTAVLSVSNTVVWQHQEATFLIFIFGYTYISWDAFGIFLLAASEVPYPVYTKTCKYQSWSILLIEFFPILGGKISSFEYNE